MKAATREWVAKAEEDFLAAVDLARRGKRPLWNVVCFHTQQCAEKYLKARLEEGGLSVPKSHDLDDLLNRLLPHRATLGCPPSCAANSHRLCGGLPVSWAHRPQESRAVRDAGLQGDPS